MTCEIFDKFLLKSSATQAVAVPCRSSSTISRARLKSSCFETIPGRHFRTFESASLILKHPSLRIDSIISNANSTTLVRLRPSVQ